MLITQMQRSATCFLLVVIAHGGGGVTKSGIEQFWADDYKLFEQVYGKTSDKEIYGETLPPSITFTGTQDLMKDASQKNERYLINYNDPNSDHFGSQILNNHYGNILNEQSLKLLSGKPATSTINFVSYSKLKPTSLESDPETYNYLKHLEEFNKKEKHHFPKTISGFKPYLTYSVTEPQETDAYKSIKDIIDSNEPNKESSRKEKDNANVKYSENSVNNKKRPPRIHNKVNKPWCKGRDCGKRGSKSRLRSRPYRWSPTLKAVVVM